MKINLEILPTDRVEVLKDIHERYHKQPDKMWQLMQKKLETWQIIDFAGS